MTENFLLNKKTNRKNDSNQYENDIKIDSKDFEGVKSINETTKNEKSKKLENNKKIIFITNNFKKLKKKLVKKKIEFNSKFKNSLLKNKSRNSDKNRNNDKSTNSDKNRNNDINNKQQCNPNSIIQKRVDNFKINTQYDLIFQDICPLIEKEISIKKEFPEHYSFYIYNNFKALKSEKGFERIKNLLINNAPLMGYLNLFFLERKKEIKKLSEKNELEEEGNIENKINLSEINNDNNCLSEDNKFEAIVAIVLLCLLKKEENELKQNEDETNFEDKNNKNITYNSNFDISNFRLNENSMVCIISGIISNKNIIELDLSENPFNITSAYCLGKLINSNKNLKKLELRRCNLCNKYLSFLIQGLKNDKGNLNTEQYGLEKLSLKDNNNITDTSNEENPICEILKIFKLKSLNLTNVQLGNSGIEKLFKTYIDLLNQNKTNLETINIINNNFKNEECLKCIGEALENPNCTLKTLILSKNLITTVNDNDNITINHFQCLMKSIGKNKTIKELYLNNCGLGQNSDDIEILHDMLCENKNLTSLRLFNNEINKFPDFHKILEIFSDYKNNLKNSSMRGIDLSKNGLEIQIDDDLLDLIDGLKLEYLDISQNKMQSEQKDRFRDRVNAIENIKIIY